MARTLTLEEPLAEAGPRWRATTLGRLLGKRLAVVCLGIIAVVYLAGILAPWVAPYAYDKQDLDNTYAGPSWSHPLGTDELGRDMLSRVVWASQTTVVISAAVILTGGLALGVGLGLLAGYAGGRVDDFIMRVADAFFALPDILLLLLITTTVRDRVDDLFKGQIANWPVLGPIVDAGGSDYFLVFGALAFFGWVGIARIIRSQVLSLRESEYVLAARAMGASLWRVLAQHLLPNVMNLIVVSITFSLGAVAGTEIMLTWLGIGVQPPHPSFGAMIFNGSGLSTLRNHPNLLLVPAAVVGVLLFAFNLLGDALTDVLSPRRR
jgi:ABC-type dipeptide/oligopeptide/nickel transport system permease subunit